MSEKSKPDRAPEAPAKPPEPAIAPWRNWRVCLLMALLAVSLAGNLLLWATAGGPAEATPVAQSTEYDLGHFTFIANRDAVGLENSARPRAGAVERAEFDLHVNLLADVEMQARQKLAARQTKIRQAIEELLREAQPADFIDPRLAELKRQFREQVNAVIDLRSIEAVMITNLKVRRAGTDPGPASSADMAIGQVSSQ